MSLKKISEGVYQVRYYADGTKNSPHRKETLKGVTYAQATGIYKDRLAKAAARRGETDDSRVTFGMIANEYVNVHCASKSDSAKERAERALKLILPEFGGRIVRSLKALDIEQYRQKRLADGVKPVTVNREFAIIKAILNKGEAWGMIERNPIRRGAVKMYEEGPGRLVFFEPEEWEAFITAFDDDAGWLLHRSKIRTLGPVKAGLQGVRRYGGGMKPDSEATAAYRERLRACVPYFKALLYTGSRPGEMLALTWKDVDLERGVLSIWQGKTGTSKTIRISKALRAVLLSIPRGVGGAPVFLRPDGKPLAEDVIRAFGVAKRIAELRKELTLYTIRHTFASWLAIKGQPIRTIQELMGHKDLRMTLRYAHLSPAHLREAVEDIEAVEKTRRLPEGYPNEAAQSAGNSDKSLP